MGHSPRGHTESDTTGATQHACTGESLSRDLFPEKLTLMWFRSRFLGISAG